MRHDLPAGPFTVKVVGLTFVDAYPRNLLSLHEAYHHVTPGDEGVGCVLKRRPDNTHDANAVEVHVPSLGDLGFVGHLPAGVAARVAPALDDGVDLLTHVASVLIDPNYPDRPGVSIQICRAPNPIDDPAEFSTSPSYEYHR